MSTWYCPHCGHQDDFEHFKVGATEVYDEEIGELIEEDEVQCPNCNQDGAVEL